MNIKSKILASALCIAFAGTVSASEVLVTVVDSGAAKNGGTQSSVALDVSSNGNVAGFSFRLSIPGLDEKSVDLSKCVAEVPTAFQANCNVIDDAIMVIGMSMDPGVSLAAGVAPIGRVSFSRGKAAGEIAVTELALGGQDAKAISATAKVDSDVGNNK
jgi:hypothetical protein